MSNLMLQLSIRMKKLTFIFAIVISTLLISSCGGSSDGLAPLGQLTGLWSGTVTSSGNAAALVIDQRHFGNEVKGYAKLTQGNTVLRGKVLGASTADGFSGTIDFGEGTGVLRFNATGNANTAQFSIAANSDVLAGGSGTLQNGGQGTQSPVGTWQINWTATDGTSGTYQVTVVDTNGYYFFNVQPFQLPVSSGFALSIISFVNNEVSFTTLPYVGGATATIQWTFPALGQNGTFSGKVLTMNGLVDTSGTCTSSLVTY